MVSPFLKYAMLIPTDVDQASLLGPPNSIARSPDNPGQRRSKPISDLIVHLRVDLHLLNSIRVHGRRAKHMVCVMIYNAVAGR